MPFRALSDLRSDIRIAADRVNQTARHPNAQLTRWINESIARFREMMTANGHDQYVENADFVTVVGNTFLAITYPLNKDPLRIVAVDLRVNGNTRTLWPWQWNERNDDGTGVNGSGRGEPRVWRESLGPGVVLVLPLPDRVYAGTIFYLAAHTALSADGDTYNFLSGGDDWVKWDCCIKIAVRDRDMELLAGANQERARVEANILKFAPRLTDQTAGRRIDTRGRRAGGSRQERW